MKGSDYFLRQAGLDGVPELFIEMELAAEYGIAPDWFLSHPPLYRDWALLRLRVKGEVARLRAEHG